jgi:hypothetical protein
MGTVTQASKPNSNRAIGCCLNLNPLRLCQADISGLQIFGQLLRVNALTLENMIIKETYNTL